MDRVSCDDPALGAQLMPVDEALQRLAEQVIPLQTFETVALADCLGRVLAEPVYSSINVPPHANSSMDGYAINLAECVARRGQAYPISQRIPAGSVGATLEQCTAARIFTGAPIPPNADAVVMQELCTVLTDDGTDSITIAQLPELHENIRQAGEDIQAGACILEAGHQLRAQDVGLLASVGITSINVVRKLTVAVFFTGDEIKAPGTLLEPGQIYNSNRYTLTAFLNRLGCDVIDLGDVEDNLVATIEAFTQAAEAADLIMTSGGVSVGEEDHIRPALETLGELAIWRISIKPGKPLAFGKIDGTPFIGLPGNPVSVFATACILARPYIKAMQGMVFKPVVGIPVPSGFTLNYTVRRREYLRVRLATDATGRQVLRLFPNQSSGVLTSASWGDGFAVVKEGEKIKEGDAVEFIPFSSVDL
ncbi:MAG: gephyrin-like molybdotransferase Glp [Leucothrix sp.]